MSVWESAEDKYAVIGDYLAEKGGGCTCGCGVSPGKHERGCGWEPLIEVEKLLAEKDESWDALLSLLDKHWPKGTFATAGPEDTGNLDHATPRDPGPTIVGLLRWVELLRVENDELRVGRRQARTDAADALRQLSSARAHPPEPFGYEAKP